MAWQVKGDKPSMAVSGAAAAQHEPLPQPRAQEPCHGSLSGTCQVTVLVPPNPVPSQRSLRTHISNPSSWAGQV